MSERLFPDRPLLGVGAVVIHRQRLLLVRRAREPGRGTWSFPGGLVEVGETLVSALVREVAEETGLRIQVGPFLGLFESVHRDESGRVRFHYVVLDHLGWLLDGVTAPGDDAAEVGWFTRTAWEALDFAPEMKELARKAWPGLCSPPSAGPLLEGPDHLGMA